MTSAQQLRGLQGEPVARAGPIRRRLLTHFFRGKRAHWLFRKLIGSWDGGEIHSDLWRRLIVRYRGVAIGRYTYGPVFQRGGAPRGTVIGAWCSIGRQLIIRRRNHPIERVTQHPLFYNARLGLLDQDSIQRDEDNPLTIGHDVWIGDRVTILSECRYIGNGAVIAGGAVVTKDVPSYAIVGGVPARTLRERFPVEIQQELEASRWWELDIAAMAQLRPLLLEPLTPTSAVAFRAAVEAIRHTTPPQPR